jgi:hypothetical protein
VAVTVMVRVRAGRVEAVAILVAALSSHGGVPLTQLLTLIYRF